MMSSVTLVWRVEGKGIGWEWEEEEKRIWRGRRGEGDSIKRSCRIEVVVINMEELENETKKNGRKGIWQEKERK
jgi:hypothetical protein